MARWLVAIPIVLPLVFLWRYLGGGIVPFGDDILLLNYPLMALIAHGLHAGYPILWNPYSGGGFALAPFSALPFYPPTWLLAALPVARAMSWTYALDLVVGGLGAYALAARLGVSSAARLVPAVVYPFSGFVLAHIFAGHYLETGLICLFPLALAALHWALDAPAWRAALRRGLVCGAPLGLLILANGTSWLVFVFYPVGLVAAALTLRAAWAGFRQGGLAALIREVGLRVVALVSTGVVMGLMGAIVLLPLRDAVGASVRGNAMSYHAATRISEPLLGLAMAVAPGLFGSDAAHTYWFPNPDAYFQEVYAYVGLPVLALALCGVVAGRRRFNTLLYLALAVLGVVFALGANTPLYGALYGTVPGFDLARTPARWLLVSLPAVAVLAGIGAEALFSRQQAAGSRQPRGVSGERRFIPIMPLTGVAAVIVVLAAGLLAGWITAGLPASVGHGGTIGPALLHLGVVALLMVIVLLVGRQLPRPAGIGLLLVLVVGDLWSANGGLVRPFDVSTYYGNAAVNLAGRAEGTGRIWSLDRAVPLRLGMIDRDIYDVQDYGPLTRLDYWLLLHPGETLAGQDTGMARADAPTYDARVADLLGVSFVTARHPLAAPGLVPLATVPVPHWGLLDGDWSHPDPHPGPAYAYRVTRRLPFALPVYATRVVSGGVTRGDVLAPDFDPHSVALLDVAPPAPSSNALLDWWRSALTPQSPPHGGRSYIWQGEQRSCSPCQKKALTEGIALRASPLTAGMTAVTLGVAMVAATENGATMRATMRTAGVLLVDQIYDPGWTATVDGRPVAPRRADYVLTAVPLGAGTHTVTLVYAPPSYLVGALLTLAGYTLALVALLSGLRGRHKSG